MFLLPSLVKTQLNLREETEIETETDRETETEVDMVAVRYKHVSLLVGGKY